MVGRAFLEALKFGATSGAALAVGFALHIGSANGDLGWSFVSISVSLFAAAIGAIAGLMAAYIALLLAGMSADIANRRVGVVVAFCVTFAASFVVVWFWALGVAAYAAIVAWFRFPRIVGGSPRCGKPVHEPGASVGD